MSQESVEIVRQLYDAVARRDSSAVLALYDPAVEIDSTHESIGAISVGATVYHGHDGLRRWSKQWHEPWGEVDYTIDDLIDAGDQVVCVVTFRARGQTSGAEVAGQRAAVWTIRQGKILRVVWCSTREEALAAVGLSE